jgi:ribonuclease R
MPRSSSAGPANKGAAKKHISGIVQVTRKGTGYLAWPLEEATKKDKEDIEIFPEKLNGALNGDTVEVELLSLFPRPRGRVVKIAERSKTQFVCTVKAGKVVPDDMRFPGPIEVEGSHKDGTKLLVELISFDGARAKGHVLQTIGAAGEHRVEMNAIVLEHGFSTTFPPEVLKEAQDIEKNHANIIASEVPKRADFRDKTTFTIDPVDAKDFDDALSIETLPDGNYEIGVHIADATYFCAPGTAIDDEAQKRGTSVYLVDATIPMLPHELSGNVCSLKADEDRLAFSAVFTITKKGEVLDRKFTKSIIRSNKRFTYEEAQEVLNKAEAADVSERRSAVPQEATRSEKQAAAQDYTPELLILRDLARIMRKAREQQGAIDFGDNEVRFTLDENGVPTGVVRKERIETNLLIEEFMLLANREVAKFVSKLAEKNPEHGLVFLYRIHDDPKADRIDELATFVRAIGYEFGTKKKKPTAKDIGHLLKQIEGKPEEHLIRTATLRSMAKAIYSTRNIGHFGLAFDYYTHFTSPIRRYPDMLVHRILASHLDGRPISRKEYATLEKMCITASEQEAKAVSAERDSIRYKQVEYLSARVGQEFDAVISGVTDWGIYVEDKVSASEGLVRIRTLGKDFFEHRPKEYAVVGQKTQKKYALGDTVRVKLVATDLAARTADFELVQ